MNFRHFTGQSGQSQLHSAQKVHEFNWFMKLWSQKSQNTPINLFGVVNDGIYLPADGHLKCFPPIDYDSVMLWLSCGV